MAAVFINDLGGNPWVLAEKGVATTKGQRIWALTYHEPDNSAHVAEISDSKGRLVARLDSVVRTQRLNGWVNGLTVDRLDSGYVIASLLDRG